MPEKTISIQPHIPVAKAPEQAPKTREESRYLTPPVDIYEEAEGLTVLADLPGATQSDVDVRVDNGLLTITGKVVHDTPGEKLQGEFELLNFYRQFELGEEVDVEKISASLKHGVLTVKLPKVEKAKPKQIHVMVA